MQIFDKTLAHLQQALDLRLERQGLLAGNVANANTPGYAPKDIDFSSAMRQAESAGPAPVTMAPVENGIGAPALPPPNLRSSFDTAAAPGFDGNRVNLDRAMVAVGENALQYNAAATVVQKRLALLSYVASDGAS